MGCTALSVHHGPSIYSRRPVIRYTVEVAAAGNLAPDLASKAERLFTFLPGLREHRAPCGVAEFIARGSGGTARTPILHLFEHVCIELQNLTGAELGCVRAQGARISGDDAVIPFEEESVGLEAGNLSLELIESLLSSDPGSDPLLHPPLDFDRRLRAFFRFAERQRLPVQDRAVVLAAEARDIPVIRIA